jgi:hypothetical protein
MSAIEYDGFSRRARRMLSCDVLTCGGSTLPSTVVRYNFCGIHKAHKMSHGMAADVADTLRDIERIAEPVEAAAPERRPRGPYEIRAAAFGESDDKRRV